MLYDYIAGLVFGIISIAIPVLFLLVSKFIRNNEPNDEVGAMPYESSEETIGKERAFFSEYIPFFTLFLPFEFIAILMLLWAASANSISFINNIFYIVLVGACLLISMIEYKLAKSRL